MTDAILLKKYQCLPIMIPNIFAKYETNMWWRTVWIIASHEKPV